MTSTLFSRIFPNHRLLRQVLTGAILLFVALAIYSGGVDNEFLVNWDDHDYVTQNPDIQAVSLENLGKIFTGFYSCHYAPLQMLSYMIDYALWGERPLPFLLVNVLLHGLNAFLYYRLLCRLELSSKWALFAALLFTIHPVQVESVAWISERKTVLSMTFFLAAFWKYLDHTEAEAGRWRHYYLSVAWFGLALLTKSVVVILPAILLAYDFILRERRGSLRAIVLEKIPFLVLAAGIAGLAIYSQQGSGDIGGLSGGYLGGSIFATVLTMLTVYKEYLFNLFWPLQLSAIYQVDIKTAFDFEVLYSSALMVLSFGLFLSVKGAARRSVGFWTAVFFIGFIPVSQIVPFITLMNDRYLYFPMLGFAASMAVLLREGIKRFPKVSPSVLVLGSVVFLLLAISTWKRTEVWASSLTLWQDAVRKQPQSPYAWRNLGNAYDHSGRHQEAIAPYRRALQLEPSDYETYYNLGTNFLIMSQLPEAVEAYRQALARKPDYVESLQNLGLVYTLTGQHASAVEILERATRFDLGNLNTLLLLGANFYSLGDLQAAQRIYEQIQRGAPRNEASILATGLLSLVALRQGDAVASNRLQQMAGTLGLSAGEIYFEWARLESLARHRLQSLEFIDMALASGFNPPPGIYDDPVFDILRSDPRFIRMTRP